MSFWTGTGLVWANIFPPTSLTKRQCSTKLISNVHTHTETWHEIWSYTTLMYKLKNVDLWMEMSICLAFWCTFFFFFLNNRVGGYKSQMQKACYTGSCSPSSSLFLSFFSKDSSHELNKAWSQCLGFFFCLFTKHYNFRIYGQVTVVLKTIISWSDMDINFQHLCVEMQDKQVGTLLENNANFTIY